MYRLTIGQDDGVVLVSDHFLLSEVTEQLKLFKKLRGNKFVNYDIIKFDEVLVDSYDLDNLDFSDLEENDENKNRIKI